MKNLLIATLAILGSLMGAFSFAQDTPPADPATPLSITLQTDFKRTRVVMPTYITTLKGLHFGSIKFGSPDLVALPGLNVSSTPDLYLAGALLWHENLAPNLNLEWGVSLGATINSDVRIDSARFGFVIGFKVMRF
jgi:hypothetical protein